MKSLSIGMFDSGIGGLTVLREVKKALPHEHVLYLGDTARVPYGNKSPETVTRYSLENSAFLLNKGIKMLIVACNTSSAIALRALNRKMPIPVVGVIEPPARKAAARTRAGKIGVIGTRATINSGAYTRAIKKIDSTIEVLSVACPLFVPIVEEGLEDADIAKTAVSMYLQDFLASGIDVLVMGCTHYPVLERRIREYLGDDVCIVDSGRETAIEVQRILTKKNCANRSGRGGCEYFVTDAPNKLSEVGGRVLGEPLKRVRLVRTLDPQPLHPAT